MLLPDRKTRLALGPYLPWVSCYYTGRAHIAEAAGTCPNSWRSEADLTLVVGTKVTSEGLTFDQLLLDYARTVDDPVFHFTDGMTIAFWTKVTGWNADGTATLMLKSEDAGTNNTWFVRLYDSGVGSFYMKFSDGTIKRPNPAAVSFTDNVWTHIVGTYDAARDEMALYQDGIQVATESTAGKIFNASSNNGRLFLGGERENNFPPSKYWFLGRLNEVFFIRHPLPAANIRALYETQHHLFGV